MNTEKIAGKINKYIIDWAKDKDKLVVGMDGYAGIGKSTILNNLVKINPDILPVNQDDFIFPSSTVKSLLEKAEDRSVVFELQNRDSKKIEHIVKLFRTDGGVYKTKISNPLTGGVDIDKDFDLSKKVLVIEGVFMFHPGALNHLWDKRIHLHGDTFVINERRIKREKKRWGKDYFPETHPDSYFKQVVIALDRYKEKYRPEQVADLVLDIT